MFLIINGNRHTVKSRIVEADTITYLSVTPAPSDINGTISMCRDDGFLMSEDNADNFERKEYSGTRLVLTNKPVVVNKAVKITPSDMEQLRADVDYIAVMLGVEL